jgi:hypothetical protein
MSDGKFYLGQLRHAYKNALDKCIGDQEAYAKYLLGPAVADAEKTYEELEQLRQENAQLLLKLASLDADQIKERNALKEKVGDLQEIVEVARKLYKAIRGTMAAQSPTGKALKDALGES